ncbi:MAG TPA: FAD-dependent oxidoreductase [Thermodesulfobacteriota bacterium]|jgi:ferredoxin--NADP+ reductase|nr:FAD-dependent oxidoreductase [Thermodesulfobacteriota bacterium]
MNETKESKKTFNAAIIGSGPAGFYAAEHLFKNKDYSFNVDIYDRLPTPFGLVRSGVAPDHQKIKTVTRVFDKIAQNPGFRFFGNVEYGKDINLDDLKKHYHIIIFATGAQTDRKMNIPGEDLKGSYTATEFVAWYNGHPDYKEREFDLSQEKVAIIGVGNVAVDVARILCRTTEELEKTDIADYALEKLANSNVKEVYMIGRRGPAQAAFTNPELKELGNLEGADLILDKDEIEPDKITIKQMQEHEDKSVTRKLELLKEYSQAATGDKDKKLYIKFLLSPVEITGNDDSTIKSLVLTENELYESEDGSVRCKSIDKNIELDVGLVFRSIGYHGVPLAGVPFNESWGVISNEKGRIVDNGNKHINGLYATGWIKRGPTGIIGTNKTDSAETVNFILEDINENKLNTPELTDTESIENLIMSRNDKIITYEKWLKVDDSEKLRGEKLGRPRLKYTDIDEIIDIANK